VSELELVLIVLSFIVGFGVNEILKGVVAVANAEDRKSVDWIRVAWAGAILIHQFQFWFGALYLVEAVGLSVASFWLLIFLAILLYLAGGLILTSKDMTDGGEAEVPEVAKDLRALLPITLYTFAAVVLNGVTGLGWLEPAVTMNVALTALSGGAFLVQAKAVRVGATVIYLALLMAGVLFVWSRPGSIVI
jgi:hypothetical protein